MSLFFLLLSSKWLLFAFYTPFLLTFFSKMAFIRHLSTISPCPSLKNGCYSTSINHFSSLLSPKWLLSAFYQPFLPAFLSKMAFIRLLYTISLCFLLQNGFYLLSIHHSFLLFSPKWLLFAIYQPFLPALLSKMAVIPLLSTISPRFFLQNGFYTPSINHSPPDSSHKTAFIHPTSISHPQTIFPENSSIPPPHIKKDSTHIEYCLTLLPLLRIFLPRVQAC